MNPASPLAGTYFVAHDVIISFSDVQNSVLSSGTAGFPLDEKDNRVNTFVDFISDIYIIYNDICIYNLTLTAHL